MNPHQTRTEREAFIDALNGPPPSAPTLQLDRIPDLLPSETLIDDLREEIVKSRFRVGDSRHMLASLSERVGELAASMLDATSSEQVRSKAISVACVALRLAEEGDADYPELEMGKDATQSAEQFASQVVESRSIFSGIENALSGTVVRGPTNKPVECNNVSELRAALVERGHTDASPRRFQVSYSAFGELEQLMREAAIEFDLVGSNPGTRAHVIEIQKPPQEGKWFWSESKKCAVSLGFESHLITIDTARASNVWEAMGNP